MNLDAIPIWMIFIATSALVLASIEAGYWLGGNAHRRSKDEKEAPIGGVVGAGLGLLAFILAFTFGIVSNRYDTRKELVREDANAVRIAYRRTEFLPETERNEARSLLREYVDRRIAFAQAGSLSPERVAEFVSSTDGVQTRLWDMAIANARKDMNSDIGALYVESINHLEEIHALRLMIGAQTRIPAGVWMVLDGLTVLGMMGVGYHAGISGSRRSLSALILALSFALVVSLIAAMDRPTGFMAITQQPLVDLRNSLTDDTTPQTP
jgi:hypothetical protein